MNFVLRQRDNFYTCGNLSIYDGYTSTQLPHAGVIPSYEIHTFEFTVYSISCSVIMWGGAFMGFLGFSLRKQQECQAIYSLAAQIYRIHGNRQYSYTEIENLH